MNIRKSIGLAAAVAGLTWAGVGIAQADINPVVSPSNPTVVNNGNGTYTYTYAVEVTSGETVESGDNFTFYDFYGLTGTPTGPSGWTVSVSNNATPPTGTVPVNDPTVPDVTFTYSGPNITGGPTSLGNFSLVSIYGTVNNNPFHNFTGDAHETGGMPNGNLTQYKNPVNTAVPEPGTYAAFLVGGLGVLGLMVGARKRSLVA
jgi:hypothetical protein